MLNEASLTDVMEPVGAIFLSRTALKEKLFHSGGLMQWVPGVASHTILRPPSLARF